MKKYILISIATFGFWLILSAEISSQWMPSNGPYTGNVYAFAKDAGALFAGNDYGVFVSTNNGSNWVKTGYRGTAYSLCIMDSNLFAAGGNIFRSTDYGISWSDVTIDSLHYTTRCCFAVLGSDLFAGTFDGIFISSDRGDNWRAVNNGLTNHIVYSLAVSGTTIFAGTCGGVFLSTDKGSSWIKSNAGLSDTIVNTFGISDNKIFAGTNGGIFISPDNGSSWNPVDSGLTNLDVRCLLVKENEIFAGTYGGGVFHSTNNGAEWTSLNNGLQSSKIFSLFGDSTALFLGSAGCGAFRSTNYGSAWEQINTGFRGIDIVYFAVNGDNLFAGSFSRGVFRSTDKGLSWMHANTGLEGRILFSIAANGTNLFAGTETGVFVSSNDGESWQKNNAELADNDISFLGNDSANVYAGIYDGTYRSTNNGANWTKVATVSFRSLARNDLYLFGGSSQGIFRSEDNGTNWGEVGTGLTNKSVAALSIKGDTVFAGTDDGVFFSSDQGLHWSESNIGLGNRRISSAAIKGNNIFAGTDDGVFLSANGGRQWAQMNVGLPQNHMIQALLITDSTLFAGLDMEGVWRCPLAEIKPPVQCDSLVDVFPLSIGNEWIYNYSLNSYGEISLSYKVNGKVSFQVVEKSFSSDSIIWNIRRTNDLDCNRNGLLSRDTSITTLNVIEINNGNHRLLGPEFPFSSVPFDSIFFNRYTYVDTSSHWSFETEKGRMKFTYIFKRQIGTTSFSAMDMCTCLDYVYVSYTLNNSHITGIEEDGKINRLNEFKLAQNYPNPFNQSTIISFYLPSACPVILKIFNITGKEISTLVNGELSAGTHIRQWNGAKMSSGVYFYRIQAGIFSETKKFILIK